MQPDPLILTLGFVPDDQARFERLRQAHFPPDRNLIPAHLTLFHHLPGTEADAIQHMVALAAARQPAFPVAVTGLRSLGRGVAFTLHAAPLLELRAALARAVHHAMTPQDRQGWRPHVTIQNKADPADARALLATMQAVFVPFDVQAAALCLWHYRGGPWEAAGRHAFAAPSLANAPPFGHATRP